MDAELKREIIMEHYNHPMHRNKTDDREYIQFNTSNSSCIDNLDIYVKIKDGFIEDIVFDGEACAISISSTSIMIKNLIGKSIDEAINFIHNFEAMVNEEEYDKESLNEAIVYEDIYKQGNRKTCAILPYVGMETTLTDYREEN